jgi:hypothetical protein
MKHFFSIVQIYDDVKRKYLHMKETQTRQRDNIRCNVCSIFIGSKIKPGDGEHEYDC